MSTDPNDIESLVNRRYEHGFVTDIESDSLPPGLDEDVIRAISARKNEPEFMLAWRLKAYRHWLTMREPNWAHVHYPPIDYQAISYFSAPKSDEDRPKSLDEVDPKLLETYENSAFHCMSGPSWLGLLWMRYSTAYPLRRRSRRSSRTPALFFARSRKRSPITRN